MTDINERASGIRGLRAEVPDLRAELCKSCIHTKVCHRDKNLVGDTFVAPNPMVFDPQKAWEKYKAWEAKGFPCDTYLAKPKTGKWKHDDESSSYYCSVCGKHAYGAFSEIYTGEYRFCPFCGSPMEGVEDALGKPD